MNNKLIVILGPTASGKTSLSIKLAKKFTHNDEIISNANILYGVSMHEGVSKIVSLKV